MRRRFLITARLISRQIRNSVEGRPPVRTLVAPRPQKIASFVVHVVARRRIQTKGLTLTTETVAYTVDACQFRKRPTIVVLTTAETLSITVLVRPTLLTL